MSTILFVVRIPAILTLEGGFVNDRDRKAED